MVHFVVCVELILRQELILSPEIKYFLQTLGHKYKNNTPVTIVETREMSSESVTPNAKSRVESRMFQTKC